MLRVLAWPGMPAESSLQEAARRAGADGVGIETVASNELLHERMLADGPWDLVFPSDYLVERLVRERALVALDRQSLPLDRLAEWARQASHDPGCRWSIPFAYGTTGYLTAGAPTRASWSTLLEPTPGTKVCMLDEVREVVGAALMALGYHPNDTGGQALAAARELLERQRPAVIRYDSNDFVGPLIRGEAAVAHAWSGPASHAVRAHPGLRYVLPEEGALLWVTTAAILADATRPEVALRLLSELMDPSLAARTTELNGYATPNEPARLLLPARLRSDTTLFPDADTRARCHRLRDLGKNETRLAPLWPVT